VVRHTRQSSAQIPYRSFVEIGSRFAVGVREQLKHRVATHVNPILFAYDTGALEALQWSRDNGIKCIIGQIDPSRTEAEMMQQERRRWPGWEYGPTNLWDEYFARRESEWRLADRVVVNSEHSRKAEACLRREGGLWCAFREVWK
jgi:hypothetical protein